MKVNIELLTQHIYETKKKKRFPKHVGPSLFYMYPIKYVFLTCFPNRRLAEQDVVSSFLWERASEKALGREREKKEGL